LNSKSGFLVKTGFFEIKWYFIRGDKKMKKIIIVLGCILIFFGCATAPTSKPDQYVAQFNYSPPTQAAVQQSSAVFTVLKANYKYAGQKAWLSKPQFANFDKAIAEDLPEIITAKGFSVHGLFDSYDLIPYKDKKTVDFYLLPVVTFSVAMPSLVGMNADVVAAMKVGSSPVKVIVKMNLELREIITRELMWSKSVNFTEFEVPFKSVASDYDYKNWIVVKVNFRPEALENFIAEEMEKQYPVLMDTIYNFIDPEEITIIQKRAQEIRKSEGF